MDLFLSEVKGGLVVGAAGVDNHAVDGTLLFDNLLNGGSDAGLLGGVGLESLDAARVLLLDLGKLLTRLSKINRINYGSAIVKAAFGDPQANSSVGSSDYASVRKCAKGKLQPDDVLAMTFPPRVTWVCT